MKPYKNQFTQPRDFMGIDLNGSDIHIISAMQGSYCLVPEVDEQILESISDIVESELAVARIASRMEF
jgi:hypothetical protein